MQSLKLENHITPWRNSWYVHCTFVSHRHDVSLKCGYLDTSGFFKVPHRTQAKESNTPHVVYRIICTLFVTLYINFYPHEPTHVKCSQCYPMWNYHRAHSTLLLARFSVLLAEHISMQWRNFKFSVHTVCIQGTFDANQVLPAIIVRLM